MEGLLSRLRVAVDPLDAPSPAPPPDRRPAAVLLLFDARTSELPLLFMQRTDHLRHHPGQIAFPGGSVEPTDASPVDAALREAQEETGIAPANVQVVGTLPPLVTAVSERWLTPVVGLQHEDVALRPDPFEVALLFHVGLARLLTAPHEVRLLERDAGRRPVHFYRAGDRTIWGVTAAILHELLHRLGRDD